MCAMKSKKAQGMTVRAYRGDAKTLLAFDLPKSGARDLAGFTIFCKPPKANGYYLHNTLQFEEPGKHAQVAHEPATSSVNAPFHKFRWLHVPGSVHQGLDPQFGKYKYSVTPRYFDAKQSLKPLDRQLTVSVTVEVAPFEKRNLQLGFTRGYTQSQAFTHHFGINALIRPKTDELLFDTTEVSGSNAEGEQFTYAEEYEWLGFTARDRIFEILKEVEGSKSLRLDVFAYDLNEPDIIAAMLKLAKQGRIRVILDDAALHHTKAGTTPEDQFEKLFKKAAKKGAAILRGHLGRYSHDKILIVSKANKGVKVLTGSTNFSVTGLYVNSNHILIYDDAKVASEYLELFNTMWTGQAKKPAFLKAPLSSVVYKAPARVPRTEITFAPHTPEFATKVLDGIVTDINQESKKSKVEGSVLFAVMGIDQGVSPVYTALKKLHSNQKIFSFGISDDPGGIALYKPGRNTGVLVTGKPAKTQLPPPFDQVRTIGGIGHQIHHKFVVCGFNRPDAVVYCGSSNLAGGGEANNGDNLLAIRDGDVATVFAIEALALVDHFHFLNSVQKKSQQKQVNPRASRKQMAADAEWYLGTTDKWVRAYYDPKDLHFTDRILFSGQG